MKNIKKLTLLHSNDMHGDFMVEKIDEKLVGGVSLLSGYVSKVRQEEQSVLYAVAGDMFRGSVIDTEYKGISTINIMNALAPDIATIGNHEIDYGIAHLLFIEKCALFPIINANLYIKSNGVRLFHPHQVFEIDGMKILFIGIITETVMQAAKSDEVGSFIDTADAAKEIGKICDAYNAIDIDLTVLLTHIGIEDDKALAELIRPEWGIDLIIGGHSHTLMKKPIIVNHIPIVQAYMGTDYVGRFDLNIDTDQNCLDSYTWKLIPINNETCVPDYQIEHIIQKYKSITDQKYERVLTRFSRELTHPNRNEETEIGNLFADIFKETLGVDIAMIGSGSIRSEVLGPIVTYGDLVECFPYDDSVYMVKVTGKQLRHMIHYMQRDEAFAGHTEYYQFSKGIRMIYSKSKHKLEKFELDRQVVKDDDSRQYSICLQEFHFNNFEDTFNMSFAEVKKNMKPRVIATSCFTILEEYLTTHPKLKSVVKGRNIVVD